LQNTYLNNNNLDLKGDYQIQSHVEWVLYRKIVISSSAKSQFWGKIGEKNEFNVKKILKF
jgi:hypothetical protein